MFESCMMCKGLPGEKGDSGYPGIGLPGRPGPQVITSLHLIKTKVKNIFKL